MTLTNPYGYIKRTTGADGEQVDLYLGPHPQSPHVYIVDQIDPGTGGFDEHKALIGFPDEPSARAAYIAGFSDGSGNGRLGALRTLTVDEFKSWLKGAPKKPVAIQRPCRRGRALDKEHGLNATDDDIAAAVQDNNVNGTDLKDALITPSSARCLPRKPNWRTVSNLLRRPCSRRPQQLVRVAQSLRKQSNSPGIPVSKKLKKRLRASRR